MRKIRVLQIEDDETDSLLVLRQLKKEGFDVDHVRVKTRPDLEAELDKGGWDIIISDYSMPGFNGLEALKTFKSRNLDIPFILVSGTVGEDLAVSLMKEGADDYLMKSSLSRLGPAVKRELEEMQLRIEKKQAQMELIQAKLAAEESSRVKSSLLANMSHEFRTPMNGILGFTEILSTTVTDEAQKAMTGHILTSAQRLLKTLNSIMTFAQLDSGYTPNVVNVNLSDLTKHCTDSIREAADEKRVAVKCHIEPSLFVHSDEHLLQISLQSLLDNAIKFTSEGEIGVELKKGTIPSERYIISIRDTGIGIPVEKQEVIFQEFRQASEGYNRPYEGSGLGLAITKKSAVILNCSLQVISEAGRGSTFILSIPGDTEPATANSAVASGSETGAALAQKPWDQPYLLLVEDNDANIDLVKLYLQKAYKLDIAKDALLAIDHTKRNKYDCILMDINLGHGMDGGEAIEKIRQNNLYINTPIIAVTGYTLQQEQEAILGKGASYYLAKPFNKKQLTGLLEQVLCLPANGST